MENAHIYSWMNLDKLYLSIKFKDHRVGGDTKYDPASISTSTSINIRMTIDRCDITELYPCNSM